MSKFTVLVQRLAALGATMFFTAAVGGVILPKAFPETTMSGKASFVALMVIAAFAALMYTGLRRLQR